MADGEEDDYAVKAAKEWWDAVVVHPGCDQCNSCSSAGEDASECHCEEEFKAQCIERNAAIIRKHAEQWAHDYSCGCM